MKAFKILRKATISSRWFSTKNLWVSPENPLPLEDADKFQKYYDFKYAFGQGGKLSLRLKQSNYKLCIHTLWEDYANVEVFKQKKSGASNVENPEDAAYVIEESGGDGRNGLFSDDKYGNSIQSDAFRVYARIPEYYSYDAEVNGDIVHENTPSVSSKIYGDVRAITPKQFIAHKLKTEECEIQAEDISVSTYLESFNAKIISQGNIFIKKCAISGKSQILSQVKGNIQIHSLFTNPERQIINKFCDKQNPLNSSTLSHSILKMLEEVSHVRIETQNGDINIQSSHGASIIISHSKNLVIDQISNQQIFLSAQNGTAKVHFYQIMKDSYLEAKQVQLSLENSFKQNIYLINLGKYFGEVDDSQPTLFVKGEISVESIERRKAFGKLPSFMMVGKNTK